MPIDNLQERLAAMAAVFDEVPASSGSLFEPPPPGDYVGLVHEFDFFDGGTPKQAFVKVRLVVTEGDQGGRFAEVVNTLEDPERLGQLKALFDTLAGDDKGAAVLGGRTYRLTDIAPETPFLISLLDVPVRFRVALSKKLNPETGRPYTNIYINERLGAPVRQGEVGTRASASDVNNDTSGFDPQQFTQDVAAAVQGNQQPAQTQGQPLPKVDGCICPAPDKGQFLETCRVPGHGIPFHHDELTTFEELKSHATRPL